jgi:pilus assembly protein CpaF
MNLADRIAAARQAQAEVSAPRVGGPPEEPPLSLDPPDVTSAVEQEVDAPADAAARPHLSAVPAADEPFALEPVSRAHTHSAESTRVRYVDPYAAIKRSVHQALLESLGPSLYDARMDEKELENRVRQTLQTVISSEETLLSTTDRQRIASEISDDILGYGPLEPYLRDREITEIMVNGPDQVYVERAGRLYSAHTAFTDDAHLRRTIDKIVGRIGRRVDESSPMVDARLPDGSRVNAVIAPVALDGSILTIRKFAAEPFTVKDLISFGTMSAPVASLLSACVWGRLNILISGGTGSGKTTTLNVVSSFIPEDERIVTIEDAAELQLHQEHLVRLENRPSNVEGRGEITTRDLVRNALRMRPDRIIVGEVRDGAALDMLQAMNTGHDGSLTTLHANTPRDALARLETMVLMGGVDLPTRAIREQAASALDLIVHQARLRDGSRRITHITEVTGMEADVITTQDLFLFDFHAGVDERGRYRGSLRSTGIRPSFLQQLVDQGIPTPAGLFSEWQ